MNGKQYWKQQIPLLCLHMICMIALSAFLLVNKNSVDSVILILFVWMLVLTAYLLKVYFARKAHLDSLLDMAERMEERYLLSEVMEKTERADDQVYHQLLKMANKSMLEKINAVEHERMEYREYIEQWVHEVKTPITAMKLICENNRSDITKEMLVELEKTNSFTEQALYYARSEHAEKDYSVKELRLFDTVHHAIAENKYLLLQHGVQIELKESEEMVFSDEKWICFILNQLIVNAVKYRSEQPILRFYTNQKGREVLLYVEDNGIGIEEADLPRIFDKGFTGKNGRNFTLNSTGIGLYLCKRLCDKLGIDISVKSDGKGTVFILSFFINDFIQQVQG